MRIRVEKPTERIFELIENLSAFEIRVDALDGVVEVESREFEGEFAEIILGPYSMRARACVRNKVLKYTLAELCSALLCGPDHAVVYLVAVLREFARYMVPVWVKIIASEWQPLEAPREARVPLMHTDEEAWYE